ncbi:MAG: LysR family transcriptional regulator [Deltaproteobacteria bacterium]|nr:LysR family transcriptional regulator [Deltaproteobacteria bacterium]
MDLRRLTLHQLRVFRAVARHRSFTRAGEELGLTQPAVSAQIRTLTDILGVPLLEQLGKKVTLTQAGQDLLEHAERMEAIVREIGEGFAALREGTGGRVRVGASTSIGTYYFPTLIAEFTAAHPGIEVTLEIENSAHIQERLLRDEFDVAYVGAPVDVPELVGRAFLEDEIFFACAPGHPLASAPVVSLGDVVAHKVFVREPGSATRRALEARLAAQGLTLGRQAQLGSVEAIKRSVMAGLGVSYFSELTVREELSEGRLKRLAVQGVRVVRTFFEVTHRDKRKGPALEAFTNFARAYAGMHQGRVGTPRRTSPPVSGPP